MRVGNADLGDVDVVVAGSGPAGLAMAAELAVRGVSVLLVAPHPEAPWRPTLCGWADELARAPGFDPIRSVRLRHRAVFVDVDGDDEVLDRAYVQLDNAGAQAALRRRASTGGFQEVAGSVRSVAQDGSRVRVDTGESTAHARLLVDATGAGGTVSGPRKPASDASLWQWAAGTVTRFTEPPVPPGGAVLMDWRQYRARPDDPAVPPSFGYVLDRGDGTHLVEETVLAGPRVPGIMHVLRRRLAARMAATGWVPRQPGVEELVAIPLDVGRRTATGAVLPVGVAAGLVHPASGYSVTSALRTAGPVAEAVCTALADAGALPGQVAAAGAAALWTPNSTRAHDRLGRGVRSTLPLDARATSAFYGAFFRLPSAVWAGYLAQPPEPRAVTSAMAALFLSLPRRDAARLARRWLAAR